jgi:hypothetical protein
MEQEGLLSLYQPNVCESVSARLERRRRLGLELSTNVGAGSGRIESMPHKETVTSLILSCICVTTMNATAYLCCSHSLDWNLVEYGYMQHERSSGMNLLRSLHFSKLWTSLL